MKRVLLIGGCLVTALAALACGRNEAPAQPELPTLDVTHWTDKTELYMEYPPLVAGQSARFAVHLTTLNDFRALAAGVPSIEFTPEKGGSAAVLRGAPPHVRARFASRARHRSRVSIAGRCSSMRRASPIDMTSVW